MKTAEIISLAERVVRPVLDTRGFDRMIVREDADSTDDPSLFVDVFLKPGSDPIPTEIASRLRRTLSQELLSAGEIRFPYLRLRHPDEEDPDGPPAPEVH